MDGVVLQKLIEQKIFFIRGQKVMLDKDLADLYHVKPRRLREQVKRNIERFPEDFMFQLNESEVDLMVSQNATPSRKYLGGYLPYAFAEQGVAMLSSVLRSGRAVQVNIQIMRAFIKLRKILSTHKELLKKIEEMEKKYDSQFRIVFEAIKELMEPPKKEERRIIGFRLNR